MRTVRLVLFFAILLCLACEIAAGEIHEAVRRADAAAVQRLLAADRSLLAAKDADGSPPLNVATQAGNFEMTKLLLEAGADINLGDNENSNALHVAAIGGSTAVIDLLIAKGMDVNAADVNGMTAVLFAAGRNKWDIVDHLATKGAKLDCRTNGGTSLVHFAARRGNVEALKKLVASGMSLNCGSDQWGGTPLCGAAQRGSLETVTFLLDNGASPNAVGTEEESPLMSAAAMGRIEVVRLLLERGADANYNHGGLALPLSFALWSKNPEIIRMILEKGADAKRTEQGGSNILHRFAQTGGPLEMAKLLAGAGAPVDAKQEDGSTPLGIAASRGYTDLVKYLASKGASVQTTGTVFQVSPLHIAAAKGYGDLAEFLMESGAPINLKDGLGRTPLYYATRYGNADIAAAIKDKGGKGGCKAVMASELLSKDLGEGEAIVYHTGHSGYAIQTKNNFLIFDYYQDGRAADAPSIMNGCINPAELKGKKVTAFVSHTVHPDHYNKANFAWNKGIDRLTWVFGQRPDTTVTVELIDPRQTKNIDGLEVIAVRSTDAGVGFLVTVDGLTIMHSGDLHNRDANLDGVYAGEIDYLAGLGRRIDLAFFPVSGCGFGDQEVMKKGAFWGVKKLDPTCLFWMHAGNACSRYAQFSEDASKAGCTIPQGLPKAKGDRFLFKDGRLKEI